MYREYYPWPFSDTKVLYERNLILLVGIFYRYAGLGGDRLAIHYVWGSWIELHVRGLFG